MLLDILFYTFFSLFIEESNLKHLKINAAWQLGHTFLTSALRQEHLSLGQAGLQSDFQGYIVKLCLEPPTPQKKRNKKNQCMMIFVDIKWLKKGKKCRKNVAWYKWEYKFPKKA